MDIALSEALTRVQTWQTKQARLNVMVLSETSQMVVKFAGRVAVENDTITLTDDLVEFRMTLAPNMILKYGDGILEMRALGWRCVLSEPKE